MEQMRPGRNGGKLKSGGAKNQGRKKSLPALDLLIAEVLADEQNGMSAAEAILKVIRSKAIKGDLKAAEMLLNRAYGKPKEHIDLTTQGESLNKEKRMTFSDGSTRDENGNIIALPPALQSPD